MNGHEIELDQHSHVTRHLAALLSAALAAAQTAAQVAAQRARETAQRADRQTREIDQTARQVDRQARATQSVQHRQWSLTPTAQWMYDRPLSAAGAWAAADVHREHDPVAARHADQWEAIFQREGVDMAAVRIDAVAAVSAVQHAKAPTASFSAEPVEASGEGAAAEVATGAVLAGKADLARAEADGAAAATTSNQWTAYADGAEAAALGGRGVSTPPDQVLAKAREARNATNTQATGADRSLDLNAISGIEP